MMPHFCQPNTSGREPYGAINSTAPFNPRRGRGIINPYPFTYNFKREDEYVSSEVGCLIIKRDPLDKNILCIAMKLKAESITDTMQRKLEEYNLREIRGEPFTNDEIKDRDDLIFHLSNQDISDAIKAYHSEVDRRFEIIFEKSKNINARLENLIDIITTELV